ncbi:glycosyltransferase involved in cell wall biosynthesis [Dysgonomonas alginatilytica]|uniref:Glycosyltransferase involved in cell wall biosynthesis n=1 Tax=Dysgonomonas alginatilytica TaxID=1605892 RepID=A0A2V3PHK4_9BACT|nr:glycosyltransferase family 4 protein [Dysgonomonas alginatilytica]PXV58448.1 glycosyltransferase involved in cell wall biosynthesis [Dysgonomonas alginatilytica]
MRIAYCVSRISNSGGRERVLANKANYLVKKGYEVYFILTETMRETPFFDFDPRIRFYSLECEFTAKGLKQQILHWKYKQIYIERLIKALDEIKPDISISVFDKFSRYLYKVSDGSKKVIERHFGKYKRPRYISRLENISWGKFITYLYRKADYDIVKHFDKFVVLTEEDKALWGDLPNIIAIPNSISFIPEEKSTNKEKRIIGVGRISEQKQIDVLIKIWAKIAKKYPEWKLVTYGNGDLASLKNLSAKLNIADQVTNNPATRNIEREMVSSSIFALTSKYEGFGLVLLEAMACGLPLVSFACKCGPRDIIAEGEDGFLIKEGDLDDFADKLSLLIENYELRHKMGVAASQNVLRFTEDIVMSKWIALFDELIKEN